MAKIDKKEKDYSKYFFVLFALGLATIAFLVVKPFLVAILTSIVFSYIFYPIYVKINKRIKHRNISALIVCIIMIVLFLLPLFFVLNMVSREAYINYLLSKQKFAQMQKFIIECNENTIDNKACSVFGFFIRFFDEPKVRYHLENTMNNISSYIIDSVSSLIFSIPWFVLNFFVVIFISFYLLKEGPEIFYLLKKILPLNEVYKKHLFEKFGETTFAIVYGYILVAIIQGILGGIGFVIFGIGSPLLWGIAMTFAALIPFLGTALIWLPAAIFKLVNGVLINSPKEIIGGVLLTLYGTIIISGIDNILRPKIIGNKAKVHPIFILVGVLGGLKLLGFPGVFVGPLILALFITFLKVYERKGVK